MRFVLLATACLTLGGCASMSKSECVYADWRAIGYEDGANGYPASAVSSRRQACAKAGVTPDMNEYLAGRDRGLEEYCTPANGFSTGESGGAYNGVCGKHDETAFLDHYRAGARLYTLRDRVRSAGYALREASENLGEIKFAIAETTTGLIRPELTVAQRAAEVVRLTQLAEQSDRVEGAIPGLRMNLESAEADLAAYEHQLASRPMLARVAAR